MTSGDHHWRQRYLSPFPSPPPTGHGTWVTYHCPPSLSLPPPLASTVDKPEVHIRLECFLFWSLELKPLVQSVCVVKYYK